METLLLNDLLSLLSPPCSFSFLQAPSSLIPNSSSPFSPKLISLLCSILNHPESIATLPEWGLEKLKNILLLPSPSNLLIPPSSSLLHSFSSPPPSSLLQTSPNPSLSSANISSSLIPLNSSPPSFHLEKLLRITIDVVLLTMNRMEEDEWVKSAIRREVAWVGRNRKEKKEGRMSIKEDNRIVKTITERRKEKEDEEERVVGRTWIVEGKEEGGGVGAKLGEGVEKKDKKGGKKGGDGLKINENKGEGGSGRGREKNLGRGLNEKGISKRKRLLCLDYYGKQLKVFYDENPENVLWKFDLVHFNVKWLGKKKNLFQMTIKFDDFELSLGDGTVCETDLPENKEAE